MLWKVQNTNLHWYVLIGRYTGKSQKVNMEVPIIPYTVIAVNEN